MIGRRQYALVLSVYANTRGFAFILFEGPLSPFDWGVREIRGTRKQERCLARITNVFDRYEPDVLVIQDTSPNGTRRSWRIIRLNTLMAGLAEGRGVPVYSYSRSKIYNEFRDFGVSNKQMLAEVIVKHIPAFERHVPPPRKPWMGEDMRIGLFDAAALGLVFFNEHSR